MNSANLVWDYVTIDYPDDGLAMNSSTTVDIDALTITNGATGIIYSTAPTFTNFGSNVACSITVSGSAWYHGGGTVNPGTISNITLNGGTRDVYIASGILELVDSTLMNTFVWVDGGGVIIDGDISGGGGDVRLWGTVAVSNFTATPSGRVIYLHDDDNGATNNASVTVDSNLSVLSWREVDNTGNSTTIVNAANTLTVDATTTETTHSFGTFTLNGVFVWSPTVTDSQTLTLYNDTTMVNASSTWTTNAGTGVSGTTINMASGKTITLNDANATLSITGYDWTNKVSVGNAAKIIFNNATGCTLKYLDWTGTGAGQLNFNGTSDGTVQYCTFSGSDLSGCLSFNSDANWDISESSFIATSGRCILLGNSISSLDIKNCYISGTTTTISMSSGSFTGIIQNCTIDGSGTGITMNTGASDNGIDSFVNCGITVSTPVNVGNSRTLELIGCVFDETNITLGTASQCISHLHNRTNNKEHFIGANITVNASTEVVVNEDTFDWTATADEWDINGNNEFESNSASTSSAGLQSIMIPVNVSTIYWVRFKGSIGASGTVTAVRGYKVDQSTTSGTDLTSFSYDATNDDYSGTITTGAEVSFVQIDMEASAAGETIYDIEIRETDRNGDLVWTEYLFNHYDWTTDTDYLTNQLSVADVTGRRIIFGDTDYNDLDATFVVDNLSLGTGRVAGFIFGYSDANNYYRAYISSGTPTIVVDKFVAGTNVPIQSSTTLDGGAIPTADGLTFNATWDGSSGDFTVAVNSTLVTHR